MVINVHHFSHFNFDVVVSYKHHVVLVLMYRVTVGSKQFFFYKGKMFTLIATKIQSSHIFGDMDN
jgi:hypothetical protein